MINSRSHNNYNSNPHSGESATSSSETMPAFDPQSAQNRTEQERSAEQQLQDHKDRLTKALLHNQTSPISSAEVPTVTEQERTVIYDDINRDPAQITAYASQMIQNIKMPSQQYGVESVFNKNDSKYARRFLTIFNNTPDSSKNMNSVNADDLARLLATCPTPLEFDIHKQSFLTQMSQTNTPAKVSEYTQGLNQFEVNIYGKRYEYAEAYHDIQRDAAQYAAQKNYREQVLNSIHPKEQSSTIAADETQYLDEDQAYRPPEMQAALHASRNKFAVSETKRMPVQPIEVYHISKAEAKKFLKKGRIDGDTYLQDGKEYQLTPEHLKKMDLQPEYYFKPDEHTEIATSKVYRAANHDVITAYVRTDKGTKIVSYYRSNSQGTWRYLPDYVSHGAGIDWFGKGMDEESLNLPIATQQALAIIDRQQHVQNPQLHAEFAFTGTAKRYPNKNAYRNAIKNHTLRGDHYQEVPPIAAYSLGQMQRSKRTPESLDVNDRSAPDLSYLENHFSYSSPMYGQVNAEQYVSKNGALSWIFNRDSSGRAWIGGIEVKSPLSSAGLHTKWAQAGDFGTPLYDYAEQDDGYGDTSDRRGRYINMWNNYLSRMPIIQKYLAHKQNQHQ